MQWTLSSSDAVRTLVAQQYKNRHDEDLNIPLSVQPWGGDGEKRRYFLIEGNDDTSFRVYRESNPAGIQRTWWSVAGSIEDLRALSNKLETVDRGPKAKTFAKRILNSIPRFEATEEKRRRREYRQMRKEQFRRPEPGFSLYEGRTRGKRMKYTYSDDEADFYSDSTNRRSTRNTRHHTPAEPTGPQTTASGRQVRAPARLNAETASNGGKSASASVQGDTAGEDTDMKVTAKKATTTRSGRPQRSAAANHGMNGWGGATSKKRKSEEYESEESDSEPDFGDDEEDEHVPDDDEEDEEEFDEEEGLMDEDLDDTTSNPSFIFKFPIRVSFDENSRVRQIPGPPVDVEVERHKHHHPRGAHRNVVMSDDDETTEAEPNVAEPEPPAAEVIAVATKAVPALTESFDGVGALVEPTKKLGVDVDSSMRDVEEEHAPQTPESEPVTAALAFRGSPEVARAVPAVGVKSTD